VEGNKDFLKKQLWLGVTCICLVNLKSLENKVDKSKKSSILWETKIPRESDKGRHDQVTQTELLVKETVVR